MVPSKSMGRKLAFTSLSVLFSFSHLAFLFLFRSSNPATVYLFVGLLLGLSVLWIPLFFNRDSIHQAVLLFGFVLSFIAMRLAGPLYENDYYRYFWDGIEVTKLENPFVFSPAQTELEGFENVRKGISFPKIATIYPPVAESVFGILAALANKKLDLFLWLLSGMGTLFFGLAYHRLLKREKIAQSTKFLLLILQHPLITREWYQACHFDSWLVASMMCAFSFASPLVAAFWIGLGVNLKPTAAAALLTLKIRSKRVAFLTAGTFILALCLPWLFFHPGFFSWAHSFLTFNRSWEMNSGIFRLIRESLYALSVPVDVAGMVSRITVLVLWGILVTLLIFSKEKIGRLEKAFWIFFSMVLMSPVSNSWYFTWSLPLVVFLSKRSQIRMLSAFSILPLSYMFFAKGGGIVFQRFWDLEHCFIWLMVFFARPIFIPGVVRCRKCTA